MQRDVVNARVAEYLNSLCFNEVGLERYLAVVDEVWNERKRELPTKVDTRKEIENLEHQKKVLLEQITQLLNYPELLQAKNEEFREINVNLASLKERKVVPNDTTDGLSAEDFKNFSKDVFTHVGKLLSNEDRERSVGLVFDIIFEQMPTFEEVNTNTAQMYPVFALQSDKFNKNTPQEGECVTNQLWQPQ